MSSNIDIINPNPVVHLLNRASKPDNATGNSTCYLDASDIYELICGIKDPEHSYTLEQLKVVEEDKIQIEESKEGILFVRIEFTPTVPHCTLATTIGLCMREKLREELPFNSKLDIYITPGSHSTETEINKQINDKERVAAALENPFLKSLVKECISYQPQY